MPNLLNTRRTYALLVICMLLGAAMLLFQNQRRKSQPVPPEQASGNPAPKISNGTAPPEKSPAEVTVPIDSRSSGDFAENRIAVTAMQQMQIHPNPEDIPGPPAHAFQFVTAGETRKEAWIEDLTAEMGAYAAAKFLYSNSYSSRTEPYIRALADQALAENPNDFDTFLLWTRLRPHSDTQENPERSAGYRKLLEMNPNSKEVLVGLTAEIWYDKPEEALQHIQKAQQLFPESGLVLYRLGLVYERLGHKEKAVEAYKGTNLLYARVRLRAFQEGYQGIPPHPRYVNQPWQEGSKDVGSTPSSQTAPTGAFPENAAVEPPDRTTPPPASTPDAPQDTPGSITDAELKHFINNMTDAQVAAFEQFIRAEFPELAELLDAPAAPDGEESQPPPAPELSGDFSAERIRNAHALLKRYGPTEALRQLRKQDPELAKQMARRLKRVEKKQESSPPTDKRKK